jgi:hypothetical protein
MNRERLMRASERWFRFLVGLYSPDFRDDMGDGVVETYRDRANDALDRGGLFSLAGVWLRALVDALRNGPGDRAHPAAWWRRGGNWGRDVELASRRLHRAPGLVIAMVGTLTIGLGTFAVVYTFVQKILIEPIPYRSPGDLYFVWRDYRAYFDLDRGWLAGTDVAELQKAGGPIEDAAGMLRQLVTLTPREGADATEISVISARGRPGCRRAARRVEREDHGRDRTGCAEATANQRGADRRLRVRGAATGGDGAVRRGFGIRHPSAA